MPRRYYNYPERFQTLHVMSSAGATLLFFGFVIIFIYLVLALKYGKVAGPNPWGSRGFEWNTPSPPTTHNFEKTPEFTGQPHDYSRPVAEEIFHASS
jgi:cytochrome c oxidase subunit 1